MSRVSKPMKNMEKRSTGANLEDREKYFFQSESGVILRTQKLTKWQSVGVLNAPHSGSHWSHL